LIGTFIDNKYVVICYTMRTILPDKMISYIFTLPNHKLIIYFVLPFSIEVKHTIAVLQRISISTCVLRIPVSICHPGFVIISKYILFGNFLVVNKRYAC
jgi:hypothetical protein